MALVVNLLLTNLFLLGIAFLGLRYGDPDGNRWVDSVARFIRVTLPRMLRIAIRSSLGETSLNRIESWLSYVMYEKNPLTMILYLFLSIGGYIAFVFSGYPYLRNKTLNFPFHKEIGFLLFCGSLFFFLQASSLNPGIITKSNHAAMIAMYPFDGTVFKKGNICPTCRVEKPARSKHCRYCKVEICRYDHHCIWINQCVGLGNVKQFLMFLLFNNLMCLYGGYLGVGILIDFVETENLYDAWFRDSISGQRFKATPYYIFLYLMGRHTLLVYMTVLCSVIGTFLLFFTWYHWVTLMRNGTTTNEEDKLKHILPNQQKKFIRMYSKGSWLVNVRQLWNEKCPPLNSYGSRLRAD